MNTDWQLECIGIRNRGAHILKTGEFSDCTFTIGSEQDQVTISAHKIILAMASPVFRAMFYGSVVESGEVISVVDIEADVFKSLLVYIYTDEAKVPSFGKAMELYYAAEKYMLPYLAKDCVAYFSSNLCAENVLMVYEFAVFNNNEDLVDKTIEVIRREAKEVLKASSFTDASLETVCMMFSMDPLNIDSELDLFAAAERYLEANEECANSFKVDEPPNMDNTASSEVNKSSTSLNTQLGDSKARTNAKFQFTVHNIGTIKEKVYSPPHYVRNLPWNFIVRPKYILFPDGQKQKMLGIYIQCNAESKSTCWSCYATYSLGIICHKPDTKPICFKAEMCFSSKSNSCGSSRIISWNDMLDPEKGYIKDDSITVEAEIAAEAPHGILGNSVKNGSNVDHRDKLTIKNALRLIRFLTLTAKQFADEVAYSKLLYGSEKNAIFVNLVSKNPSVKMPLGFCTSTKKRQT